MVFSLMSIACHLLLTSLLICPLWGAEIYVSPTGSDDAAGTASAPLATLEGARQRVRALRLRAPAPVTVVLRGGTHVLAEPLRLTPEDSGTPGAPVVYRAADGEMVIVSGGRKLNLTWKPYRDGIYQATLAGDASVMDELYLDGRRLRMARYPNFDPKAKYFGGTSPDAVAPDRVKGWSNPAGGFLHALHEGQWGSKHYEITGASADGKLQLRGGWQENRGGGFDPYYRGGYHQAFLFVENILEELDAPGEWYFDRAANVLYCQPPAGVELNESEIVTATLKELIALEGSANDPVHDVHFVGLSFRHTARVFMEPYERLLRGDWSIARLGAVRFQGTEDCSIRDSNFNSLGGNAVFLSGYNRRALVEGNHFAYLGESAVCLVGDYSATRSQAIEYSVTLPQDAIDLTPGPRGVNYPKDCLIENNLMHHIGLTGKQIAGVFISMSESIRVSHNTIYETPRAAICINDGCWGGHIIEHNDVFHTVRETGDHGPFNSWGRDRFWKTATHSGEGLEPFTRERAKLDNWKTTHIRNNRFAHNGGHSWGIDLDDGTSNYDVYNNLCLGMGIKFREGFFRRMENNVIVRGFGGFHIWLDGSDDVVARNIIVDKEPFQFIRADPSVAKEIDHNLFWADGTEPVISGVAGRGVMTPISEWQSRGFDRNSMIGDPLFIDPASGDYRVKPASPALKLGFENFPMDEFGVTKPEFQAEVARVERSFVPAVEREVDQALPATTVSWLGATVKNVTTEAEMSAIGIGKVGGVHFLEVPRSSAAAKAGLRSGDVIVRIGSWEVATLADLRSILGATRQTAVSATVYNAVEREVQLPVIPPPEE
jgi:parallel beta helix pectate lyase-like protein